MPVAGQPTLYKSDYCTQAHNYCLLGATNEDLAGFFDVTRRTIDNWIATHPGFAEAVRSGQVVADACVARCLYERAVGWRQTVERTVLHQGEEKVLKNVVNHPPDVSVPASFGCVTASARAGATVSLRRELVPPSNGAA